MTQQQLSPLLFQFLSITILQYHSPVGSRIEILRTRLTCHRFQTIRGSFWRYISLASLGKLDHRWPWTKLIFTSIRSLNTLTFLLSLSLMSTFFGIVHPLLNSWLIPIEVASQKPNKYNRFRWIQYHKHRNNSSQITLLPPRSQATIGLGSACKAHRRTLVPDLYPWYHCWWRCDCEWAWRVDNDACSVSASMGRWRIKRYRKFTSSHRNST